MDRPLPRPIFVLILSILSILSIPVYSIAGPPDPAYWLGGEGYRCRPTVREEVFEFTAPPVVKRVAKDRYEITFAVKAACDVTVGIVRRSDGRILRHLASGVLGPNAPAPLASNSAAGGKMGSDPNEKTPRGQTPFSPLRQTIIWDGKDDRHRYVDDPEGCDVRVSLGLTASFAGLYGWHPKANTGVVAGLAAGPEGVFVLQGQRRPQVRLFDHGGKYLRTVFPPSASVSPDQLAGMQFVDLPDSGRALRVQAYGALLPPWYGEAPPQTMALSNGRLAFVSEGTGNNRIAVFSPDGKWLKAIPFAAPGFVAVHHRTGAIYVEGLRYTGRHPSRVLTRRITKLKGLDDPAVVADFAFPAQPVPWQDRNEPLFCLDSWADPPMVWIVRIPLKDMPGAKCFQDGFGVGPDGRIAVVSNIFSWAEQTFQTTYIAQLSKEQFADIHTRLPLTPGRNLHNQGTVWVYDPNGLLVAEDVVKGAISGTTGAGIDRDGNVYVAANMTKLVNGKPFLPAYPTGTLIKAPLTGARVLGTWGSAALDPLPSRPPDFRLFGPAANMMPGRVLGGPSYRAASLVDFVLGRGQGTPLWQTGLEWAYPGVSEIVPSTGSCTCPTNRFALDYFARSFIPEVYRFSVGVVDANGNLILHIGRYGNADDGAIHFAFPSFVSVIDGWLFVSDAGNDRIVRVKLGYRTESAVPVR